MGIKGSALRFLFPAALFLYATAPQVHADDDSQENRVLLSLPLAIQTGTSEGALLEEIIQKPGQWNQMCSLQPPLSPQLIPLFGYSRYPLHFISKANLERLRAQRAGVLTEISRKLRSLTPSEAEKQHQASLAFLAAQLPEKDTPVTLYLDVGKTDSPLDEYLVIILDLNGVETLPALLELESALHAFAPYQIAPTKWAEWGDGTIDNPWMITHFKTNTTHPSVLSIITALLLNENHAVFRNSPFYERYKSEYEAVYAKYAAAGEFGEDWQPAKTAPERTEDLESFLIDRDRRWNIELKHFIAPYNATNRDEIVQLAQEFLREVSPADYKAASAMAETPWRR